MDTGWDSSDALPAREEAALAELVRRQTVSADDIRHATSLAAVSDRSVLTVLNQAGALTDNALAEVLSEITGLRITGAVPGIAGEPDTVLNPEFLKDHKALMLSADGPLAVVDPFDDTLLRGVEFALGSLPPLVLIRPGDWAQAFPSCHPAGAQPASGGQGVDELLASEIADQERDAPVVKQVSAWISGAVDAGASDIHFDARRTTLDVQYRIDGVLRRVAREPKALTPSVIARIKVIADLDLGERNRAQDGRSTITVRGRRVDVRVSVIPTIDGEGAVIRILDRPDGLLSLSGLGFPEEIVTALERASDRRHGMFIVAGPTGSGKTTTLYACLERMKGRGLKILSVEDPVEYHFDHVNQVQISEKAGRTFAAALRSFLRHDPDVIMVGEIRDSETAQVAVQAALSGHLVLATLHATDTARVRTRLADMGIEPFKIDACLTGSMAQRLVRLLCPACAETTPLPQSQTELFTRRGLHPPVRVPVAAGCPACGGEGYRGRVALAECAAGSGEPPEAATLMHQALRLVSEGKTTLSEVIGLGET